MPNSELVFPVMCHFTNFPNGGCQLRREPEQTKYLNRVFLLNCQAPNFRSSLILGALNERAYISVLSSLGFMNLNFSWKHDQRKGQIRNGEEKDKNDLCQPTLQNIQFLWYSRLMMQEEVSEGMDHPSSSSPRDEFGCLFFFLVKKAPSSSVPSSSNCFSD